MAQVARRKAAGVAATDRLSTLLTEYRTHRSMVDDINKRVASVKAALMAVLEREGTPDERGSLWIEFEHPTAGYKAIKRERRTKLLLDEAKAERILRDRDRYEECIDVDITIDADQMPTVIAALKAAGIYDKVVTVTERISDDKILQLYYAEQDSDKPALTEADIDAMFHEEVTWAFVPKDAK